MNPQQKEAIFAPLKPVLLIAGAGTGKTTIIIERIIHLIEDRGISPSKIWVITFTNRAINEIKTRLSLKVGTEDCMVHTFHSALIHFVRTFSNLAKIDPHFKIVGSFERIKIIEAHSKFWEPEKLGFQPKHFARIIRDIKLLGFPLSSIDAQSYLLNPKNWINQKIQKTFFHLRLPLSKRNMLFSCIQKTLINYETHLQKHQYLDFDDILNVSNRLLEFKVCQSYWSHKLKALLIDEFQDLNDLQLSIIKKIYPVKGPLLVVGDPNQSIYGFRGSSQDVFQSYYNSWNPIVIKMTINYRSSNELIKYSNNYLRERLNSSYSHLSIPFLVPQKGNKEGIPIEKHFFNSPQEEIEWIIKDISDYLEKGGRGEDIALLYRNNQTTEEVISAFQRAGIPYRVTKEKQFSNLIGAGLVIAWLTLSHRDCNLCSEKIFTELGELSIKHWKEIRSFCRTHNTTILQALERVGELKSIGKQLKEKVCELLKFIKNLRCNFLSAGQNHETLIKDVWRFSCSFLHYIPEKMHEASRNISHLIEAIDEEKINILDINTKEIPMQGCVEEQVVLSTIHDAKGAEYKAVYLMLRNNTKGTFSSKKIQNEEKRVIYVSLTRAKEWLKITTIDNLSGLI